MPVIRIVALGDRRQPVEDGLKVRRQRRPLRNPFQRMAVGGSEGGEVAGIEGATARGRNQLRTEEHQEQAQRPTGIGQRDVRLGIVDEEDVARFHGLRTRGRT